MLEIARRIFDSGLVRDDGGAEYPLGWHTSLEQCEFLQRIVTEIDARRCLEIGLAYGISSLFICEAISGKEGSVFHSLDPLQSWWKDVGLRNLKEAGFDSILQFHRDYSHNVLPRLLADGVQLDFAYVDTSKRFDVLMVDSYFLGQLLREGGVMVFDDCLYYGVRRLVRYLSKLPHLRVYGNFGELRPSRKRAIVSALSRAIPRRERVYADEIVNPAWKLGIHAHCVAFQKTGEDTREWDWDTAF